MRNRQLRSLTMADVLEAAGLMRSVFDAHIAEAKYGPPHERDRAHGGGMLPNGLRTTHPPTPISNIKNSCPPGTTESQKHEWPPGSFKSSEKVCELNNPRPQGLVPSPSTDPFLPVKCVPPPKCPKCPPGKVCGMLCAGWSKGYAFNKETGYNQQVNVFEESKFGGGWDNLEEKQCTISEIAASWSGMAGGAHVLKPIKAACF
jgi:hypothetical protein